LVCSVLKRALLLELRLLTTLCCRDSPNAESEDPEHQIWFAPFIPEFQRLPDSSLPLGTGIVAGISYQTYCLSPTRFLQHRLRLCRELGAETEIAEVRSLQDVFKIESCSSAVGVVNCTGLGARKLVPDEKLYPTKGQTIIVNGKAARIGIRVGGKWDASAIPQPGSNTTLLAGCKLENDWYEF
jgi:D-amino-acid oxidase